MASDEADNKLPKKNDFLSNCSKLDNTDNRKYISKENLEKLKEEVVIAHTKKAKKEGLSSKELRRLKRYDVLKVNNEYHVIGHRETEHDNVKYAVCLEDAFDKLQEIHLRLGHKRTAAVFKEVQDHYMFISRVIVDEYLRLCIICQYKKKARGKGLTVKPIIASGMNNRAQIDLIDMQSEPDGNYKFILNYQLQLTKYCILYPLERKTAEEVAQKLVRIFCDFGAPMLLHSDNGREFCNQVIRALQVLWPGLKLINGRPRHSQSQGSVERANQDVRDILTSLIQETNTRNWSALLPMVQFMKNSSLHKGIKRSPYCALFGAEHKNSLETFGIPPQIAAALRIETEEDLITAMKSVDVMGLEDEPDDDSEVEDPDDSSGPAPKCSVCNELVTGALAVACFNCEQEVHLKCSRENLCILCSNKKNISEQQAAGRAGLLQQAERMVVNSNKKFKPACVGDNVVVRIPEVDRGRLTPRNILAVVTNVNDENKTYELGTIDGTLKSAFSRNQFSLAQTSSISVNDVPTGREITVRSAAAQQSNSSQGFVSCNCTKGCASRFCSCKKSNILCNSKCHDGKICKNKG